MDNQEPPSGPPEAAQRNGAADHLRAYRWRKGESGNPGGRPKRKIITEAYEALLETKFPGDPKGRTYAQLLAEGQMKSAIKGKTDAAREVTDRTEGPVSRIIEVGGKDSGPIEFNLNVKFRDNQDQ